jgi:hypothetical protein
VEDVSAKVEARSVLARVQAVQGLAQEARMALAEVDALASQGLMMSSLWLADAAFAAHALGVEAGLLARAFSSALPGLWVDAAQAITRGDMGRAAGIFAEIGSRPDEAHARALLADGQPSGRR